MTSRLLMAGLMLGALAFPVAGYADDSGGTARDSDGASDAISAGAGGPAVPLAEQEPGVTVLPVERASRLEEYVVAQHRPSYDLPGQVVVGEALPARSIRTYPLPTEFGMRGYRYTIVDGHAVLVDPSTHEIVQIID